MHVTPADLRAVRREGLVTRFAVFDRLAYVLAELPATGTRGTQLEELCREEHWGFVLRGALELERGDERQPLQAGSAFHVPAGEPAHRFLASRAAVISGFVPLQDEHESSDEALRARGFELLTLRAMRRSAMTPRAVSVVGGRDVPVTAGDIRAKATLMGSWLLCQAEFGAASGYVTDWCDLPHWGIVARGNVAIEWENDIEVLRVGDVYYCPEGPPGHKLQAADSAVLIDYTPLDAYASARRVAEWRPHLSRTRGREELNAGVASARASISG